MPRTVITKPGRFIIQVATAADSAVPPAPLPGLLRLRSLPPPSASATSPTTTTPTATAERRRETGQAKRLCGRGKKYPCPTPSDIKSIRGPGAQGEQGLPGTPKSARDTFLMIKSPWSKPPCGLYTKCSYKGKSANTIRYSIRS